MKKLFQIKINLHKVERTIPYHYYPAIHGYVSALVGNEHYGLPSNDYVYCNPTTPNYTDTYYSKEGIIFRKAPFIMIRTASERILMNFVKNFKRGKVIIGGMSTYETELSFIDPSLVTTVKTHTSSPILVQHRLDHDLKLDEEGIRRSEQYLVRNIMNRAKNDGIELDESLSIKILEQYAHNRIKYGKTCNIGRVLKLCINADTATKEYILLHGLGRSCGVGFGFLEV